MSDEYSSIRQVLGELIGKRVIEITQHDREDWEKGEEAFVMLMFEDGNHLKFPITDLGFEHTCEGEEAAHDD